MGLSGIQASTNSLALTGLVMYIDDDVNASATISGETLQFSAEFAQLFAGKGVKVLTAEHLRQFGIAMQCNVHEITPQAMQIIYGGDVELRSGSTRLNFKQKMTPAGNHNFTFKGELVDGREVTIYLNNAKNTNYGDVAFDGQDFSAVPCIFKPYPETVGDNDEVMAYIDVADAA
jgi:hypothetical protein